MSDKASNHRLFFSDGDESRQICTIRQNPNDGTIYFSAPKFGEIDWQIPTIKPNSSPQLGTFKAGADGKLSLHGSGVTHVRPHQTFGSNEFAIQGAALKDPEGKSLGVRHLLTIFLSEPTHQPDSPFGARKTDYLIAVKTKQPYVFVFWAVPIVSQISSIGIQSSFEINDLESVPPDCGWGWFSLIHHGVIWFAYRTKHMERWPLNAQACYFDGYYIPILIGTGVGTFHLELRPPGFSIDDKKLAIKI